ncbi:flagellar basal-body MS-ring/collar protein FliF [Naasia lichenicola]|uniref:Flagellar M-ring protein n=1 Tax=Naasia lichenicola TaxID=2565933 RepID=A0A4S4FHU8_9MICO|nr:flagellar basal-body MS-ring/collar protein FliF [Naasia lichenicola]THG29671.1 flagellar M-ring protein FliF [Naasia lichenicola]
MANKMTGAGTRALGAIREFTIAQRTIALIGVGVLVLGGIALSAFLGKPSMSPLFSGLSGADASSIVEQLDKDGVEYQLTDGGGTILVPTDKVDAERISAAAAGLPSEGTSGYALLDDMGVTASEFQQNVTYKRAIEGELAKTIESIDGVRSASVQLAIPKESVFVSETADPTASVFISTATTLGSDQIQAIVHLTSAAVDGLKAENVSVVDAKGNVLSSVGGGATGGSDVGATYEATVRSRIQTMLDTLVGPGNSTVAVAADVSSASGQRVSETYTVPDGAPALSEQTTTEGYGGTGDGTGTDAVTGVLGSSVDTGDMVSNGTTTETATDGGGYDSQTSVKNNAINKVTETSTLPVGEISRQTISVAINADSVTSVDTTQISDLVSAAAGVDQARGDKVTVEAASFSTAAATQAAEALKAGDAAQSSDSLMKLITTAVIVVGSIIALIIVLSVLKKLFKRPEPETVDGGDMTATTFPNMDQHLSGLDAMQAAGMGGQYGAMGAGQNPAPLGPPPGAFGAPQPIAGGPAGYGQLPEPIGLAAGNSEFERLQADVNALAASDPEKTADYLRALMDTRQPA